MIADNLPMAGIRVLELGVWVAGPAAAAMLADWGADVIKVESPTGDPQRGVFRALGLKDGRVAPFEQDNRGKRSLVLDLTDPGNAPVIERLIAQADIVITNMRPAALDRLGLSGEAVRARHPHIIYGRLTGYGPSGEEANRAGYDVGAFWSRTGIATRILPPDQPPPGIPTAIGDHMTAVSLVAGLMAALFHRERTGQGALVDTSLLRTGIYGLSADFLMQMYFGRLKDRAPREEAEAPLVSCYRTSEGKWLWLLAVESTRHWPKLLAAIGKPELADKPEFATAQARYLHKRELVSEIDQSLAMRTREEWGRIFDEHDLWWAPVQTVEEVTADPQAIAAGAFVEIAGNGAVGPIRGVATPVSFNDQPLSQVGPAPQLGEHTDAILSGLAQTGGWSGATSLSPGPQDGADTAQAAE